MLYEMAPGYVLANREIFIFSGCNEVIVWRFKRKYTKTAGEYNKEIICLYFYLFLMNCDYIYDDQLREGVHSTKNIMHFRDVKWRYLSTSQRLVRYDDYRYVI